MKLGEKIKALITQHAMTKRELAKKLKFKDSSVISHWTSGRFYPSIHSRKRLADVFDKPIEYFEDDVEQAVMYNHSEHSKKNLFVKEKPETFPNIMHVGIIGNVISENFTLEFNRTPNGYLPIFMEVYADKRIFALKIESSCLQPMAYKGDYVIVEQTNYAESGELAMVKLNRHYVIRRVFYSKENILLKSDNASLKSIRVKKSSISIAGRIKGIFKMP